MQTLDTYGPREVRPASRSVPLSRTGTHRGRLTMPLTVRTEPHFLPVGETTGSGQEGGICARLAAAIYCLSGDLFLLLVCCQAHWDEWC